MEKVTHLCPGCFIDKGSTPLCPHCGYNEESPLSPIVLPPRTLLHNQYLIGRVLGKPGGFGITYLAWDTYLETCLAIKEYFPRDFASRDRNEATLVPHSHEDRGLFQFGLKQFLQEGRTLAAYDHPNIVRVRTFFEDNGTGYLVMDYYEGMSLAEYLEQQGGRLDEPLAIDIMMPILDGLRMVHERGVLHRDIDPHNIYLTQNGRAILLDFGAARLAVGERSKSMSVILKPGYAPYEQYHSRGQQGPWTDIYACAATLYKLVTGEIPPDSVGRAVDDSLVPPHKIAPGVSTWFSAVLMKALSVPFEQRPQTIDAFQQELRSRNVAPLPLSSPTEHDASTSSPTEPIATPPRSVRPPKQAPAKSKIPNSAWGGGILVLLFIAIIWGVSSSNRTTPEAASVPQAPQISLSEAQSFADSHLRLGTTNDFARIRSLYADQVDYYDMGIVGRSQVMKDKIAYFERWPLRDYSRTSAVDLRRIGTNEVRVKFNYSFLVRNGARRISGDAYTELRLRRQDSRLVIVEEKGDVSRRDR